MKSVSCRAEYGAFMEPSGRNQWQPVANVPARKAAMVRRGRRFESVRGLQFSPCLDIAFVLKVDASALVRRPPSVHQRPRRVEGVEELDRVLASVASEVAVVAVDHRQAGAHVTGEVER